MALADVELETLVSEPDALTTHIFFFYFFFIFCYYRNTCIIDDGASMRALTTRPPLIFSFSIFLLFILFF